MDLSSEDALHLNVLLANPVHAIRIDESSMTLYGLSERGQAKVQLRPNCRDEQYLRCVREMLSSIALGHPGGYPVFLKRWTRMGQMRDERLDRLLMLGEPEAVTAVVCAPGLTDELARRAWWAVPTSENARKMLERDCVVCGQMGKVLARHLVEHLPFEEDPSVMMDTVRLVLQPGLIDEQARLHLWNMGKRKTAYRIGFLEAVPDDLPEPLPPRHDWERQAALLAPMIDSGNPYAKLLVRALSAPGQTFLHAAEGVLRQPANHEVVIALLNAVAGYFSSVRAGQEGGAGDIETILEEAQALCAGGQVQPPQALHEVLAAVLSLRPEQQAMIVLSRLGERVVAPILSRTTAIGALMRRKLEPVLNPILQQFAVLRC